MLPVAEGGAHQVSFLACGGVEVGFLEWNQMSFFVLKGNCNCRHLEEAIEGLL